MTREEAIECLKTIQRWTPDWDDREDFPITSDLGKKHRSK